LRDLVATPIRAEVEFIIVTVGHSLLVTMPLTPLTDVSRALQGVTARD
jgi:hypothetical protein